jgi:hypothetical protein
MLIDDIVDNDRAHDLSGATMFINNGKHLWIANYPYAYGCVYGLNRRPSIKHILKLRKYETDKRIELVGRD